MVAALFDTNILIDFLGFDRRALDEIARYDKFLFSVISWMEVMVGVRPELRATTRSVLNDFRRVEIDDGIAERAVEIRHAHRIKLPDAIIWATAQTRGLTLVTRNTRDFPEGTPGVRIPYTV